MRGHIQSLDHVEQPRSLRTQTDNDDDDDECVLCSALYTLWLWLTFDNAFKGEGAGGEGQDVTNDVQIIDLKL